MAKATIYAITDAEVRKRGEQTGLDTLVVHAVNDDHWTWVWRSQICVEANAISIPPGEYARKGETQKN